MPSKKSDVRKRQRSSSKNWLTRYVPRSRAIHSQAPGLGRSLKTKLKTDFYVNVTHAATGVFTGYLFPGSCFDPCGDLAALQPSMFDQLAALYARYLVTDAEVTIEALPSLVPDPVDPNTYRDANVIAAYPSTVTTAMATFQGAASQPYAQSGVFQAGMRPARMHFKLNAQKVVGSRLPVIAEDCGALVSASPTTGQNMVLPIFIQHAQARVGGQTTLRIKIVQTVIFDQKIQNADA